MMAYGGFSHIGGELLGLLLGEDVDDCAALQPAEQSGKFSWSALSVHNFDLRVWFHRRGWGGGSRYRRAGEASEKRGHDAERATRRVESSRSNQNDTHETSKPTQKPHREVTTAVIIYVLYLT